MNLQEAIEQYGASMAYLCQRTTRAVMYWNEMVYAHDLDRQHIIRGIFESIEGNEVEIVDVDFEFNRNRDHIPVRWLEDDYKEIIEDSLQKYIEQKRKDDAAREERQVASEKQKLANLIAKYGVPEGLEGDSHE